MTQCMDGKSHENLNTMTSTTDQRGKLVHLASEKPVNIIGRSLCGASPLMTKGYGLKKWRRIKRNIVKDPNTYIDSSKILKRGLSGAANSTKHPQPFPLEMNQNSEGSIGSTTTLKNVGFNDDFAIHGSNSNSKYAFGSAFALGTDSESSEDRSSKSSTAASAPKSRYDLPVVLGCVPEKNRIKNMSSNNSVYSTQQVQRERGGTESTKKPRGERDKMEKENSQSSMESDSRSSNVKRGVFTVTCNKKHSGRSIIYDGGVSDEAQTNEHFPKEAQAAHCKEKEGGSDDHFQKNGATNLSWNVKEEKSENNQPSVVEDPLFESICGLRSLQEALEEEVHKLGQIGSEPHSPDYESINYSNAAADIAAINVEGIKQSAPCSLELQILNLAQNINVLECKLEESQGKLELRDLRIAELEAISSTGGSSEKRASSKEMESELEDFFRQNIEEEIKYLVIKNMIQSLKVATVFQPKLLKEQETLFEKQAEVVSKFGEAGSKALVMKTGELQNYCDDVLLVEETLKMQKRVCAATFCFFMQIMLLILVLWFIMSQLSLNPGLAVPT